MPRVVLFTATTLDGYIARPDGNLDWLIEFPNPDNLDYGYSDFMLGVGSIIMGKNTYNEILSYGIDWPYKGIESYVVASNPKFEIKSPDTYLVNESLSNLVERLKTEKGERHLVGRRWKANYLVFEPSFNRQDGPDHYSDNYR